ncbi:LysR family transcriptional regulator [Grimontia kaedaensis]|uniref:LysR family transcriptional regulator n=1 Tax=Grimontia kaedaensis TaxID=2872157 RepID=A0ABY4WPB0_9GAMM|nr:LysR family transcriptional regulator [Grimontia kaedaensis]USH01427.1 LysR family transcriptional regulator [Grimontia kaedaensis]
MRIENFEAFVNIARLGSFTQAAEECFCTQATMSQRIKKLEDYYKVQLLHRDGRGVELTLAGQQILPYCEAIIVALRDSKNELLNIDQLSIGELKICSSNTPGTYILPQILSSFHLRFPGIELESQIKYAKDVINEISFGSECELGFVSQPADVGVDDKKLMFEPILRDGLAVIVSPQHPMVKDKWEGKHSISLDDLQGQTLLTSNRKSSTVKNLETTSGKSMDFKQVVSLGSMEAVKKSVELNAGIAIASHFLVHDEVSSGKLLSFSIEDVTVYRFVMLVHRRTVSLSPTARAFVEYLKKDLAKMYPTLCCDLEHRRAATLV